MMNSTSDVKSSRPRSPWQFSLRSLFGMVTLCAVGLSMGLSFLHFIRWQSYSYRVEGAQYGEVNDEGLVKIFLPPQATNITAWIQPRRMRITASFRIREQDFVAWANKKAWRLKEIRNHRIANISENADPNDDVMIKDGLWYKWEHDPDDPGTTMRVYAYDRSEGVGYFTQLGD